MQPKTIQRAACLAISLGIAAASCSLSPPPSPESDPITIVSGGLLGTPIVPVVETKEDPARVALGRRLFLDPHLSGDDTISCASCHSLSQAGVDGKIHSKGIGGQEGGVNAPTVLNSGGNFVQFWDGRAATLEDQVNGPTHNPKEMGSNWTQIVAKLEKDDAYRKSFREVYGEGAKPEHVRDAIAAFERTLTTPNAPVDRFLKGDANALDAEQRKGYRLFREYGCVSCHQGANVGGNMYERLGVMADYFKDRGHVTDADLGRYAVTKRETDRHVFRVPSLRNVALTAPYFHDGSASTLPQAVEVMAHYQLGRPVAPDELRAICRFLEGLTGDQPKETR